MISERIRKGMYWDKAWSLVDGCTPCSPGCENCWSAGIEHRFRSYRNGWNPDRLTDVDGKFKGIVKARGDRLDIPLKTKKPTVFAVWNDLFHEDVSFEFQTDAWLNMALTHRHTFLVLTKRIEGMKTFVSAWKMSDFPHIWSGVTVCNQKEANEKIPQLLQVPGHKWLSIEPMLGPIFLSRDWIDAPRYWETGIIQGVVVGCETGPHRRPCNIEWSRSIVEQCKAAGVPCFVKQLEINGKVVHELEQFPPDLRVRELAWRPQ